MNLFGTWLVKRGTATADDIVRAIEYQWSVRPHLHKLAMKRGLLRASDVLRGLNRARETGLSFGASVVELKLLSHAQLRDLETEQRCSSPKLGEVLVELRVLSQNQLLCELERFVTSGRV